MSLSSFEGSPLPADIGTKYEKLASEYAKVRAQVSVLKKAVVEEQTRCAELKDEIKSKDQVLRKHDQEFDSLNFRNQQLTKRITVLQAEISRMKVDYSKKGRVPKIDPAPDNIVMQEELEKKLKENMRLVNLLEESRTEFESERQLWQQEVSACKTLVRNSQKEESDCNCESLRRSLAAAEAALKASKTGSVQSSTTNHTPPANSQRVRVLLQDLPLNNLIKAFYHMVCSASQLSKLPSITLLEKFKIDDSADSSYILQCLTSYSVTIGMIGSSISDKNEQAMLNVMAALLNDLSRCVSNLEGPNADDAFSAVIDIARSIRSTSQYHLGALKEIWEDRASLSPYDLILSSLSEIFNSSNVLWQYASDCVRLLSEPDVSESILTINENTDKSSCSDCGNIRREYEGRISELMEKINQLSVAEQLPIQPKAFYVPSETNTKPSQITNDFGDGIIPNEVMWPEVAVKEFVLLKTSQIMKERQIAESKLTRYITERNAAQSRMVASEEQCMELTEKINNLMDELSVTKRNYKEQLSSMSEHLANMNDKLAAQETEIEELRFQVLTKENKKTRLK